MITDEEINRLKQERAELAAQVEVIRKALAELKSEAWSVPVQQLMYRGNFVVRRANDALSITPSAALREIQARTLEEYAQVMREAGHGQIAIDMEYMAAAKRK